MIALYGPTAERASKVAVSIFREEGPDPDHLQRWCSEEDDVRHDPAIEAQILAFILDLRGFVGVSLFGRTERRTRAN
jgi:hypothetical protein